MGIELDPEMIKLSKELGADWGVHRNDDPVELFASEFSRGYGVDAVVITAATTSSDPVELAGAICREKGRVVVVGAVRIDIPRKDYYEKELCLSISRAFGPGSYDKGYVEKGIDYPVGYVRWTAKRNMEEFLSLVEQGKVNIEKLITHRFKIRDAPQAYEMLRNPRERMLGALFEYEEQPTYPSKITLAANRPSTKKANINLGFIGAGSFAQSYLLPNFKKIPYVHLKGVATATGISARNVAEKFHFEYCTSDYREILADPKIDCVVIATRHNLHAKLSIEALKSGKVIYVEKPLAISEAELGTVIKAYEESQGRLMIGFNRRFSTFTQKVKRFFLNRSSPLMMNYRVNAGPLPPQHWTRDAEEGGGRIIGEVCHFVDLLQYIADAPPVGVYAETVVSHNENIPKEDNVNINIKFDDGSIGTISYSALGNLHFPRERFEIFGEESVVVVDNFKEAIFTRSRKKEKMKKWWGRDMGYQNEINTFIEALKLGKEMPIDFKEIVSVTLATFEILNSIQEGLPMKVDLSNIGI